MANDAEDGYARDESHLWSILFDHRSPPEPRGTPSYFADLNLDQIFALINLGREEYDLLPFFAMLLDDIEDINYRHEIMHDLERPEIRKPIESLAQSMKEMRLHLGKSGKLHYAYQKASWFLDAVEIYLGAVNDLLGQLSQVEIGSRGLREFLDYLRTYTASEGYVSLDSETKDLKNRLSGVVYCVLIKGNRVTVSRYEGEEDYSIDVERTFHKFKQGAVKDYRATFYGSDEMNNVETRIHDRVVKLYPDLFSALWDFYQGHENFLDRNIARFDREVQFYLGYLELIDSLRSAGLSFCYPSMTKSKEIAAKDAFDLALAKKLVSEDAEVVCNDFHFTGPERVFVVSGPNQGGKTTFARMFGQLHHLARLGYPVPGKEALLFQFDHLFTHFEREEHFESLRGKLEDELFRMHEILQQATSDSIIIVNEGFASTTLEDAQFIGHEVLSEMIRRDMLCVFVSFIDELSRISEATVSMVSSVDPDDPTKRTFKIERRPADGRAYAIALARKYGLTYEVVRGFVGR